MAGKVAGVPDIVRRVMDGGNAAEADDEDQ
jgi:hypothetical protein